MVAHDAPRIRAAAMRTIVGRIGAAAFLCAAATSMTAAGAPPKASTTSRTWSPSSETLLLSDFRRYCLDTGVDQAAAITVAKRAGLEVKSFCLLYTSPS